MTRGVRPLGSARAPGLVALAAVAAGLGCGGPHAPGLGGDGVSSGGGSEDGAAADPSSDGAIGTPGFTSDSGVSTGMPVGAGCATGNTVARRQPVYLMFVLDGSDSMKQQNKWAAVVPALTSIFGQMEVAADPGVGAGLIIFPDIGGPFPGAADVPLAFVDKAQSAALARRLTANLNLGTPTQAALNGGYGELETFQPKAPLLTGGKKVVILITDGVPTDACSTVLGLSSYPSNACVTLAASKLTEGASKGGPIETFVVGVGDFPSKSVTSFDPAFLGHVAQAGGTGPARCNPAEASVNTDLCYFEVDPSKARTATQLQQKFETALDAIRGQVVSCTFPLQATGLGSLDPTLVNVEINGKTLLQSPTSGWSYDNPAAPAAIVLNGAACDAAKSDLTVKVTIVVGCHTQAAK